MKCPLCGKRMTTINETAHTYPSSGQPIERIYFCEQHGAMNKLTDLKEKADQVSNSV